MSQHSSNSPTCCSSPDHLDSASAELKLYRAFIFSVPIFFTFILLFLFYVFYLRPRRVDWSSLRMRPFAEDNSSGISRPELGLKKELREMLPIIVYKESFFVKDTQCSVCLLDYQPEERLQQIPACGHTFHMGCIDLWLANHSTCPLCRLSLLPSAKSSTGTPNIQRPSNHEETPPAQLSESRSTRDTSVVQNCSREVASSAHCIDVERENAESS
ncbi:RING-H2 finger protein ATL7-like [Senna tora]|uniref:RING-type E3 ubiquitin transferase n=1 Tax=Senna tora TaxID=362788 RepID=A0A834TPV7_9FABA|nr:RING-H2 finger protein ATL7-like [Senna tora]